VLARGAQMLYNSSLGKSSYPLALLTKESGVCAGFRVGIDT